MNCRAILGAVVLLLTGCGTPAPEAAGPIDSVQLNAIASSGPTVAETLATGNDALPAAPTPVAFAYDGVWAASAKLCATAAWQFEPSIVKTNDVGCTVLKEEPRTDNEVKLTLSCGTGQLRTVELWSLVQRNDGTMIVARSAGNDIPKSMTLRRCA